MEQIFLQNLLLFLSMLFIICSFFPPKSKFMGRPLWYDPKKFISFELDSKDANQQIMDIYSFSHISHGILFYLILKYFKYDAITGFYITIFLEILWEIFENTPFIINKYRRKKEYENYRGDSVVNMIGDVIFTILGYYLTYTFTSIAIIYLIASEFILLPFKANFLHLSFGSLINS